MEVRAKFSQYLRSAFQKKNNYTLTLEVRARFSQYLRSAFKKTGIVSIFAVD